jgi:hypothetical protein
LYAEYTQTRDPFLRLPEQLSGDMRASTLAVVLILISYMSIILLHEDPCGNRIVPCCGFESALSVLEPRPPCPLTRDLASIIA